MSNLSQLIDAYSVSNLTNISAQIIKAWKEKHHSLIFAVANACYFSEDESASRLFGKIIQLYHPDKSESVLKALRKFNESTSPHELIQYSHIFKTEQILKSGVARLDKDISLDEDVVWEATDKDDYHYYDESEAYDMDDEYFSPDRSANNSDFESDAYSFYEAIQLRELGDLKKTFPTYYLEDLDEFELTSSHIDSLDGAQYCKHAIVMDLSDNMISDLSELWDLQQLEELYLANNQLSYIDGLANLINLKVLDVSFNEIDDFSPLFVLENLEFINLIGNPIKKRDLEILKKKGVQVVV